MGPLAQFILALTKLVRSGAIKKIPDAIKFAEQQFGKVSPLLKKQIEKVFESVKKPVVGKSGKKQGEVLPIKKKEGIKKKPIDPDEALPNYKETPGAYSRRITPGTKENLLEELKSAYPTRYNNLRGDETAEELKKIIEQANKTDVPFSTIDDLIDSPEPSDTANVLSPSTTYMLRKGIEQLQNPYRPGGSLDPVTGLTRALVRRILDKKGIEIGKNDPLDVFNNTFGESSLEVKNLAEEMLEIERRGGGLKDLDQMLEADGLFDIEIPTNPQKGLTDDELLDLVKKTDEETTIANKRMMTADELENFEMEISPDNLEAYNFDGTVEDGARILREEKQYMDDMELEYKKGNLDPKPGEANRQRFLQKKFDEMEASGDTRLMTIDEIEELSSFDLQIDMDEAVEKFKKKDAEQKKIIEDFDPGDRDSNATGGRVRAASGGLAKILNL